MDRVILGKVLQGLLLPPGGFILLGLCLTIYLYIRKQRGRSVLLFITFFLYFFSTAPVAFCLLKPLELIYPPLAQPGSQSCQAVILLGGGAVSNAKLPAGGNLAGSSANRLLTAATLAQRQRLPIIVSGGALRPGGPVEAEVAAEALVNLGIGANQIIQEDRARNTQENADYVAALCKERGFKSCYLVTSAYHLPRAMFFFQKACKPLDISLVPLPCDYQVQDQPYFDGLSFLPSMDSLALSGLALKEYVGCLAGLAQ